MAKDGSGRTALVTGASAGIGKAFAVLLAQKGFDLVLTARREDRLKQLAQELQATHGIQVHVIAADLTNPAAPANLAAQIHGRGLKCDVLINNAGYAVPGEYAAAKWEDQRDFIQVLVTAPSALAHAFVPGMAERGYGRIVNVASVAGLVPGSAGHTLYGASKAYMVKFSQSLHLELEARGVHVTALCPGFTLSEFHDVTGTREVVSKMPSYMWLTAERVVSDGYRAVMRNKAIEVPGLVYKFLVVLAKLLPDSWALAIVRRRSRDFRKID